MLLFLGMRAHSQLYNYVHYDTRDGLAGSTVYCVTEDKDGFKWFGTESGVSRFDGSKFVNFTVAQGLPDNEVFEVFGDSKGRVWIATFSKQICYYFQGKIFNPANTPWLNKFQFKGPITNIVSDSKGNLVFSDRFNLYWLDTNDSVYNIVAYPAIKNLSRSGYLATAFDKNDNLIFSVEEYMIFYKDGQIVAKSKHPTIQAASNKFPIFIGIQSPSLTIDDPSVIHEITFTNHRSTFVATTNGAWAVDTINNKLADHFLPGLVVTGVLEGIEKELWFATIGNGVYKLPSRETRTIRFQRTEKEGNTEVFSLMYWQDKIYGGLNFSEVAILDKNRLEKTRINLKKQTSKAKNNFTTNRQLCHLVFNNQMALLGFDAFLAKITQGEIKTYNKFSAIKSLYKIDDKHFLLGNYAGAFRIRLNDMELMDTIWRGRITKAHFHQGTYYIGTPGGLYKVNTKGEIDTLSNLHPTLGRRIVSMAVQGALLWVASSDMGVVALKDGKPVATINAASGLSSDLCRTLFTTEEALWVGTNKGLNKVTFENGVFHITKFGLFDGLPAESINAILVRDSMIYVATSEGLTFFKESNIAYNSICRLRILDLAYSSKGKKKNGVLYLPYNQNNIALQYTAISFRSAGDIKYYYRILGLNTNWQITRNTELNFPALPSGAYKIQLQAVNRFGIKSELISIPFVAETPFWNSWWFLSLVIATIVIITATIVQRRSAISKRKIEQQLEVEMKLASLEQQALQAQMNPHFIFNCLNSIQHFFLTNDGEKANKFLSIFAALVRETLHFSSQKSISVSEEVNYLSRYLEMEKMRFGDKFVHRIYVDPLLQTNFVEIPALLLQPYVENAIRHGVRHKRDGIGHVQISFLIKGDDLHCIVADNGVGREKTKAMQGRQPVEYQSRGIELGQKRVEALNKALHQSIKIEILDLKDATGLALGTEIHLVIPLTYGS